jgi:hypothetical protein
VFLQSRNNVLCALRVSCYNVYRKQVTSQGILSFKGTLARSRYKVVGPDIRSRIRAKTVTSKLTLPSVLVVVIFREQKSVMIYRGRFAKGWLSLPDGAHGPVLQISQKQNR